ncbi:hypothetical protein ALC57_12409 [Trachymyrmex cornetzi]|uniref:Uncharacterized protein n=1 Tax=Trachymyrmex cornetzi TaxID=471704 RepID=A0A195DR20_9HYME|nr:hypothetical protein ALC57_12409 [Trachymyrmex cornetzi]
MLIKAKERKRLGDCLAGPWWPGLTILRYEYITRNLCGGAYRTYEKHVYRRALEIVGLVLGSPRPTPASYPTTDTSTLMPNVVLSVRRTVPIPVLSVNYY